MNILPSFGLLKILIWRARLPDEKEVASPNATLQVENKIPKTMAEPKVFANTDSAFEIIDIYSQQEFPKTRAPEVLSDTVESDAEKFYPTQLDTEKEKNAASQKKMWTSFLFAHFVFFK